MAATPELITDEQLVAQSQGCVRIIIRLSKSIYH